MCLIISKNISKKKISLVVINVEVDTAMTYGWVIDENIKLKKI